MKKHKNDDNYVRVNGLEDTLFPPFPQAFSNLFLNQVK